MSDKVFLQGVGFYYRLPELDRLHILQLLAQTEPVHDEEAIARYLESGLVIAAVPGVETDLLLPDTPFAGALHIRTDGYYAWPQTLSYWVRRHHILLPEAVLKHIRFSVYRTPSNLNLEKLVLPSMC